MQFTPAPLTGSERTSTDSSQVIHQFENGLVAIIREDRSAPVASVQAWVNTGSIHEGKWLGAGLSHILEHMLFKGTENRDTNEIAQHIQDQGGYINAYTSFDRTVYWIDIPAEGVITAVDILSDAMMNSTLPEDEYVKEQEVIRREFAMGFDSPERTLQKLLFENAFLEHPYRYPVIGHLQVYNQLTRGDVMEYYKARYVPNNMFFVVVGDVNAQEIIAQLEKSFEGVPRGALTPVFIPSEPEQLSARTAHRSFPSELTRLYLSWPIPDHTDPDMPALDILASVLGDGRSARLNQKLREELGIVHSIAAFSYTPRDRGIFAVMAVLDPGKREEVEQAISALMDDVIANGITAEELEKARKMSLASQYSELQTMRGQASEIGSNWMLTGDPDFGDTYLASLQQVTLDDVKRVAAKYIVPQRRTTVSLNPPAVEKELAAETEAAAARETTQFTLPNGLRVLAIKDARLPLVTSGIMFRGGVLYETPEINGITSLMAGALVKGTASRTAREIADTLESVGGGISSESGNNTFNVFVNTMTEDWITGLDILADVVLNPSFPENEIERERGAALAAIRSENDQILRLASRFNRKQIFGEHPYSQPQLGTIESVSKLTRGQLVAHYEKLRRTEDAVIVVVGDIDPSAVKNEITARFSTLPTGSAREGDYPDVAPIAEAARIAENADKEQAVILVGYVGPDIYDEDRYAIELIDQASSDLGSRFFVRIRDELGLAYFVGSSYSPGLTDGAFSFYVGTDPAKVDLVEKALLEEIDKLAKEGLTEIELTRAKKKLIGQQAISNQSNSVYAQVLALDELYDLGYEASEKRAEAIEAVTLEQVRSAAKRWLQDRKRVITVVGPGVNSNAAEAAAE